MEEGTPPKQTSLYAVLSLCFALSWLGGVGSLFALGFAHLALQDINASGGTKGGENAALAGIILGMVGLLGVLLLAVAAVRGTV